MNVEYSDAASFTFVILTFSVFEPLWHYFDWMPLPAWMSIPPLSPASTTNVLMTVIQQRQLGSILTGHLWCPDQKAASPGVVPGQILKLCTNQQAMVFISIFNLLLQQSTVLICFKENSLIPLSKRSNLSRCSSPSHSAIDKNDVLWMIDNGLHLHQSPGQPKALPICILEKQINGECNIH